MSDDTPRLGWLPKEEWTDEAREVFAFWGEPNAWEEGSKTNIMMTMAHHPAMTMAYNQWGKHLLIANSLPVRELEILILRVGWRVKSEYEWHNHVGYGLNAGLTHEDIHAIRDFPKNADRWEEKDRVILESVDELIDTNTLSDETWATLRKHYDKRQVMDLVMSIGHYVMTSWAISAFGVEIEGGADPVGFDLKTGSGREAGKTFKPGETENWTDTRGY